MDSSAWDAIVNESVRAIDDGIARVNLKLAEQQGFLAQMAGDSVNADVLLARERAQANVDRMQNRLARLSADKLARQARLHAALNEADRAVADDLLLNRDRSVVQRAASSSVSLSALQARVTAAMQSVANPDAIVDAAKDASYILALDLMERGQ